MSPTYKILVLMERGSNSLLLGTPCVRQLVVIYTDLIFFGGSSCSCDITSTWLGLIPSITVSICHVKGRRFMRHLAEILIATDHPTTINHDPIG